MTIWDALTVARRRWYVVALGLIVTLVCVRAVARSEGVYWSRVNVRFLLPVTDWHPNSLQFQTDSLITLAGAVGKAATAHQSGGQTASETVTLVGQGVTHGYSVRLPNSGGQWAVNYADPLLDVQAVGPDARAVHHTMDLILGQIEGDLYRMQDQAGVVRSEWVRTALSPPTIPIYYSGGSRTRAVAMTLLIGLSSTGVLLLRIDHMIIASRLRRADQR